MEDLAMASSASMFVKANNFPGQAALSLINGSSSAPQAPAANNSSIRAEAMQEQGVGQNINVSC